MLKADIDSGSTGDKIEHYDVGMAQLGTCDEAAGTPPTPERIALARKAEAATRRTKAAADPHGRMWLGVTGLCRLHRCSRSDHWACPLVHPLARLIHEGGGSGVASVA